MNGDSLELVEKLVEDYGLRMEDGRFVGRYDSEFDGFSSEWVIAAFKEANKRRSDPHLNSPVSILRDRALDLDDDPIYCAQQELLNYLRDNWTTDGGAEEFEEVENDAEDYIYEEIDWYSNDQYIFSQLVDTPILIDAGDGFEDFYSNTVFSLGHDSGELEEDCGIVWLAKTQGYTYEQLKDVLFNDDPDNLRKSSKFMNSLYKELQEATCETGILAFQVQMPLLELSDLFMAMTKFERDNPGYEYNLHEVECSDSITIPKDTVCGIFDFVSGAGGVFEIKLEKDVKVPLSYIFTAFPEGMNVKVPLSYIFTAFPEGMKSYSITEVYGEFWGNTEVNFKVQETIKG